MRRFKHNLSHHRLSTMSMGVLTPIDLYEVLPGDSIQDHTTVLVRCQPMVAPPLHPTHKKIWKFFVPYRILQANFQNFITGGINGLDATVYPTISIVNPAVKSLADHLGVTPGTYTATVSAFPFRAYAQIINDYFVDEDLVSFLPLSTGDGNDVTTNTSLFNVAWAKDYFTSARPWTQKGPGVSIPVGGTGVVAPNGTNINMIAPTGDNVAFNLQTVAASTQIKTGTSQTTGNAPLQFGTQTGLQVTLSSLNISMSALRNSEALQKYQEDMARHGSRYTEYTRQWGVISSDARLQRAEFIAGGKETLQFSEVMQTGVTTSGSPAGVGNFGGHGIGSIRTRRSRKFFEEHGIVMTLMAVAPIPIYQDQVNRLFFRRAKEDFFQPQLAHIGQQPIYNAEIYGKQAFSSASIFGYQDRYDEYRRHENSIHGQFRTTYNMWHFGRAFGSNPALNSAFITCTPSVLPFADQTGDDTLMVMSQHKIIARRIVPANATPRLT